MTAQELMDKLAAIPLINRQLPVCFVDRADGYVLREIGSAGLEWTVPHREQPEKRVVACDYAPADEMRVVLG